MTPDPAKKAELLQIFSAIVPDGLATETSVWDDTNWGRGGSGQREDGLYEKLLQCTGELGNKQRLLNQSRDARIAETAIKAGLTLVTIIRGFARQPLSTAAR